MSAAKLTATSILDLRAQLRKIDESYERLERGEKLSLQDLLSVPSLLEIRVKLAKISPQARPQLNAEEIARRDHFIQQHVLEELLHDIETDPQPVQRVITYAYLLEALEKYDATPSSFLQDAHLAEEDYKQLAQLFQRSAIAYVNHGLRVVFETAALSADDADTLRSVNASANDRLNALLRPLSQVHAQILLNVLESALRTTEKDIDLSDYVDDITPDNIFDNAPEAALARPLTEREDKARKAIEKALGHVLRASDITESANRYEGLRAALNMHRMTVDSYVGLYDDEAMRNKIRETMREKALAYVNARFRQTISVKPSEEDEAMVVSESARPADQLNALFRNVADKEALRLLDALEEAGFDLDEEGLTRRILEAGAQMDNVQGHPPAVQGPAPAV